MAALTGDVGQFSQAGLQGEKDGSCVRTKEPQKSVHGLIFVYDFRSTEGAVRKAKIKYVL